MTSTMTMEAWLAQLEMEMDPIPSLINNNSYQQNETMEASFDEQLAATLGDDFPYPLYATSDTASPQEDFDCNLIEQFISTPHMSDSNENNISDNNNNNNINNDGDSIVSSNVQETQPSKKKEATKKQATSVGTKRKRQPTQVQDHIIAERKRREILSQMFISLSAIVPGLKKIDKTSVLGEAIKHMKQLQEKVKVLEEVAAKRIVESAVVVRKYQVIVDNGSGDDNVSSSTVDDYCVSGSSGSSDNGGGGSSSNGGDSSSSSFPEIEVKISGNTLLLRVYCEKQKGILAKLFAEVDKHDLSITNFSVIPFESLAVDITVVAQMERGFNKNVKDFVRTLRNTIRLGSYQRRESIEDDHCSQLAPVVV